MADSKKISTPKKLATVKSGNATKSTTTKKAAPRKSSTPKKPAPSRTPRESAQSLRRLDPTPEERYLLIEKEAYYRAEKRGFRGGHPAQDWLEAEAYIDKLLRTT